MKKITIIACISSDRGLGQGNDLLWRIPADQQFFRQTTLGHPVVMGGRTFRSIGQPLPKRQNLVLSRQAPELSTESQDDAGSINRSADSRDDIDATKLRFFASLPELEDYLVTLDDEIFIIGGAALYQHFLPQAETLYLTEVEAAQPADVYFPEFDSADFTTEILQTGETEGTHGQTIKYRMVKYERR